MPVIAHIALGSNLGDRAATLTDALARLCETPGVVVEAVSAFREYPSVGGPFDAPPYLNAAARLSVDHSPPSLLNILQEIERRAGRKRSADDRNAPRTLDLDLLLYGDLVSADPALTLPHPRMADRRFVLEPLSEISPHAVHATTGLTIAALLRGLPSCDAMLHSE